jgi:hypothetical protein
MQTVTPSLNLDVIKDHSFPFTRTLYPTSGITSRIRLRQSTRLMGKHRMRRRWRAKSYCAYIKVLSDSKSNRWEGICTNMVHVGESGTVGEPGLPVGDNHMSFLLKNVPHFAGKPTPGFAVFWEQTKQPNHIYVCGNVFHVSGEEPCAQNRSQDSPLNSTNYDYTRSPKGFLFLP